ncbi:hypothetical protein H6G45_16240 [Synechocystis sp. FACHB-383]|uniref:hypothetical protein n=1 Tax=Synechocystis sp. FACHB-383 TaxID=2692864 RepID=UPI0016851925|nr:hypothetical protein [Synechocystis sp. FACHB-383]MBD2655003.1 hypothetical protein [Synechocystis sp. FACHB-383]
MVWQGSTVVLRRLGHFQRLQLTTEVYCTWLGRQLLGDYCIVAAIALHSAVGVDNGERIKFDFLP